MSQELLCSANICCCIFNVSSAGHKEHQTRLVDAATPTTIHHLVVQLQQNLVQEETDIPNAV